MKENYDKTIQLACISCGDIDFEINDDKTWVKCNRCGREYLGGYNELVEYNRERIDQEMEELKKEVLKDVQKDIGDMLKQLG